MRTSTLLTFLCVASAEQLVAEEQPRLLPTVVSLLGNSADALQVPARWRASDVRMAAREDASSPLDDRYVRDGSLARGQAALEKLRAEAAQAEIRAPRPALRAGRPQAQFGFQNFDRDQIERDGLRLLSPIAGPAKRDPDQKLKKFKQKEDAVVTGTLPALAVLGAPLGGGAAILLAALLADPNLVPDSLPFKFLNRFYPPAIEKAKIVKSTIEKNEKIKKAEQEKEAKKKAEKEAEAAAKAKEEAAEAAKAAKGKAKAR